MIASGLSARTYKYGQPHPGDHLKLYIQTRVKHSLYFDESGVHTALGPTTYIPYSFACQGLGTSSPITRLETSFLLRKSSS